MSPGKKHRHRYSDTPLKSVKEIYQKHLDSLAAKGNSELLTQHLSKQSDEWKRLYPKTNASLLAATSGEENIAGNQSETGGGSLSDVTSIGHQLPELSLNSLLDSGIRPGESIQIPGLNASTEATENRSDLSSIGQRLPELSLNSLLDSGIRPDQSIQIPGLNASTEATENLSDLSSIGHRLPELSLNSPLDSKMKLDKFFRSPESKQSTSTASVNTFEQEDSGKKRFQSQSCTRKKSRLDTDSPHSKPPLSQNSPRAKGKIQDESFNDTTTKASTLVTELSVNPGLDREIRCDELIQIPELNSSTKATIPVDTFEQEDTSKKRFQSQSCTGKKSRLDSASLSLNSPTTKAKSQDDSIQNTITKTITLVTKSSDISEECATREPTYESPSSSISGNMRQVDSAKDLSTESNPDSTSPEKSPSQEAFTSARDEFVRELESIVNHCENETQLGSFSGNENDEHLNTFKTQLAERLRRFRETLRRSLTIISEMELAPYLNVSTLSILHSDVLKSGIDVEEKWLESVYLRVRNPHLDLTEMARHYRRCWTYYKAYQDADYKYVKTISFERYPN